MRQLYSSSIMPRFASVLFVLITLAISFEYKYHNVFRQASKRFTPKELVIPHWFERKIVFHPSDVLVPILLGFVVLAGFRRFSKEMGLALALPFFAALSVATSPWWDYTLLYVHLWPYFTMAWLFIAAALLEEDQRARVIRAVTTTLIVAGTLQALIAMGQYFSQHSLGLRWLGEPPFDRMNLKQSGTIVVPDGCLWIVDRWLGIRHATNVIVRATGTLGHTNVLGGFLMMTSLLTVHRFATGRRGYGWLVALQFVGLTVTFSRAAFFGFLIGLGAWLVAAQNRAVAKRALALVLSCGLGIGLCFHEQIVSRGGIVNYNAFAQRSDAGRVVAQNVALTMMQEKPLTGVGFEQFGMRVREFLSPEIDVETHQGAAHNIFLLWGAETGLLSLGCYLALFGCVAWIGWQRRKEPDVACLCGLFGGFMFIGLCDFYLLVFQAGRLMLFLVAGLIVAHRVRKPRVAIA